MPVFEIKDPTGISMHLEFDARADFARDDTTREELDYFVKYGPTDRYVTLAIDGNVHTVTAAAVPRRIRGALKKTIQ